MAWRTSTTTQCYSRLYPFSQGLRIGPLHCKKHMVNLARQIRGEALPHTEIRTVNIRAFSHYCRKTFMIVHTTELEEKRVFNLHEIVTYRIFVLYMTPSSIQRNDRLSIINLFQTTRQIPATFGLSLKLYLTSPILVASL